MRNVKKGRLEGFASRLKKARVLAGLTRETFAAAVAVPSPTAASWEYEAGEPSIKALAAICRALGVSGDYLLGLSETPAAPGNSASNIGGDNTQTINAAQCRDCATVARLLGIIETMQHRG